MKIKSISVLLFLITNIVLAKAQITVGANTTPPTYSQVETITAGDRGLHVPSMNTAARDLLVNSGMADNAYKAAATGLMVYNTDAPGLQYWDGNAWQTLPSVTPLTHGTLSSSDFIITGGVGATASGDLTIGINDHSLDQSYLQTDAGHPSTYFGTASAPTGSTVPSAMILRANVNPSQVAGDPNYGVSGTGLGVTTSIPVTSSDAIGLTPTIQTDEVNIGLNGKTFNLNNAGFFTRSLLAPSTQSLSIDPSTGNTGVRINTAHPNAITSLDVNGSLTIDEQQTTVTATNNLDLSKSKKLAGQLKIDGTPTADYKLKLPAGVPGQIIIISNTTAFDCLLNNGDKSDNFAINSGNVRQFVYSQSTLNGNPGSWIPSTSASSVGVVYFGSILIPQFQAPTSSNLTSYNTTDWTCESIDTYTVPTTNGPRPTMSVTYTYTGTTVSGANPFQSNSLIMLTPIWPYTTTANAIGSANSGATFLNGTNSDWVGVAVNVLPNADGTTVSADGKTIHVIVTRIDDNSPATSPNAGNGLSAGIMISNN